MSTVNAAARYGATPLTRQSVPAGTSTPTTGAGREANEPLTAGPEGDQRASSSILRNAKASADAGGAGVVGGAADDEGTTTLPPIGNVGHHFDSRM